MKDFAELNIFYSIFNNLKSNGFNGLVPHLEIIPISKLQLEKVVNINNIKDEFAYFNTFKSITREDTFRLANIKEPFGVEEQKKWFLDYVKKPNKLVQYVFKEYKSKLAMNSSLQRRLDSEFLELIEFTIKESTNTISEVPSLSVEQFQDLIFITLCETKNNPSLEYELSDSFKNTDKLFWDRFNELYENVFKQLFNDFVVDSFFLNEKIKKDKEKYGFEFVEDNLLDKKYPKLSNEFSYYLNMPNRVQNIREEKKEEYQTFRKNEYALYLNLCAIYKIKPIRDVIF